MGKSHLLIAGKNKELLKELGDALTDDFLVLYCDQIKKAKEILKTTLSLSFMIVDIDDFDETFEIAHYVKKYPRLATLPVFVLGKADANLESKCFQLGGTDYIKKPYQIEKIVNRVKSVYHIYAHNIYRDYFEKDILTNVYNKEYFLSEVEYILQENPDKKYDLICFDIDRFKLINDLYGTAGGDRLLQYIAKVYSDICMQYHWIIGRLHNDVFVILMERGSMSYEELTTAVSRQLESVSVNVKIVLSFGIYPITDCHLSASVMCDRALMTSKSIKGNYETTYKIYQDVLRQNIMDEQTIINEMENALVNHEFVPYYQPKYNIETGSIIGFEALVRWIHPQKGIIPPNQFIPLFESNGFISQVDFCIWEQVCQDLRRLLDKGYYVMPISVNVSRIELYLNIKEKLLYLLDKYNVPIELLRLEITETAYTNNPEQLIEVVDKLRKQGFSILMDDFGSGYSSLNMLKEVPVDVLKIDLNFLQDLQTSGKSEKILESVLIMSRKLSLSVIAEGVETKEQIDFLRSIGCLRAQGYYYSRPVTRQMMFEIYEDQSIAKGDTKDEIERLINIDDVLNNIHKVDDIEWYRSAILRLDAQIFEFDFITGSMRYYDSRLSPQTGELSKIEVPNYLQRIQDGYHIHPDDVEKVMYILSGHSDTKESIRAKPYFSDESYQWYSVITHTIYNDYNQSIIAVGVMRNISEYKLNEVSLFALSHMDTHDKPQISINEVWQHIGQEMFFDRIYSTIRYEQPTHLYMHYQHDYQLETPTYHPLTTQQQQQLMSCYQQNGGIIILQKDEIEQNQECSALKEYFLNGSYTIVCLPILRQGEYVGETVLVCHEKRNLTESERNVLIEIGKYINSYMDSYFFSIQLQEKNALYNAVVENMYSSILMLEVTPDMQTLIYANKAFYQLYGYDDDLHIPDLDVMELLVAEDRQKVIDALLDSIHTKEIRTCLYRGTHRDGHILSLEMRTKHLEQSLEGKHVVLVIIDDRSAQIHHQQETRLSEMKYKLAFEQTHRRLWDYNIKTKQLYRSKAVQEDTGTPELIENVPEYFVENNYIHPDYHQGYLDFYRKISQGEDCDYLFKALHKDGVYKWMHITYHVLFDEYGQPDHAIGFGEDVNEVYANKIRIQQEQYYEAIMYGSRLYYDINLSENSIVYNDHRNLLEDVNEFTYTHFLEYITEKVVSPNDHQKFLHEFSRKQLMHLFKEGKTLLSREYELGTEEKRWYEIDINLYTPIDSTDICAFITTRDIDERKRYELSLEFNVKHDDLTGVYTRNAIQKYVESIIKQKPIAVMMIDVNEFKLINDTFGHTYGDDTLRNIADVLLQVVNNRGVVGRMGGDEFIVVIDDFKDRQEIINMAKRINDSIHLTYVVNQEKHTLSCSIGIACSDDINNSFKRLYRQADENLYNMKKRVKI